MDYFSDGKECPKCLKLRHELYQKEFADRMYFPGDIIKCLITQGENSEYVFVKIKTVVDYPLIHGIVDCNPVNLNMRDGDSITVSTKTICQYFPKDFTLDTILDETFKTYKKLSELHYEQGHE